MPGDYTLPPVVTPAVPAARGCGLTLDLAHRRSRRSVKRSGVRVRLSVRTRCRLDLRLRARRAFGPGRELTLLPGARRTVRMRLGAEARRALRGASPSASSPPPVIARSYVKRRSASAVSLLAMLTRILSATVAAAVLVTPPASARPELHGGGKFVEPVQVAAPPGDERLFIVEQPGPIRVLSADGTLAARPFLDITDELVTGAERGLLGLAFAPDYATTAGSSST